MPKVSRANAEHYLWGGMCDGWHLVRTAELSVIEERMPPGAAEARHSHERARQFFYVLSGKLTIEIEGDVHELRAGDGIEVPPMQAHQAMNSAESDAHFLVVSQPPSHADRVSRPSF